MVLDPLTRSEQKPEAYMKYVEDFCERGQAEIAADRVP